MKSVARSLFRLSRNLVDRPAVILLYHRITKLKSDPQQLAVSPENFDEQIKFVKANYTLIGVDEFEHSMRLKKKLPKRCVVLTFDDGYADNFHEARPILERHGVQALFYIATANLDTPYEFWWDDLERVFLCGERLPMQLNIFNQGKPVHFNTSSSEARMETYDALHPIIKALPFEQRSELMTRIIDWSGLSPEGRPTHRMMTADELMLMARSSSVVIGAHTHTHSRLSICSAEEQRSEISQSKTILETLLNQKIVHFSYPFGTKEDYTSETVNICRDLGFTMVTSNYYDQVHSWHSEFELPRILVRNWPINEFKKKMLTFFTF